MKRLLMDKKFIHFKRFFKDLIDGKVTVLAVQDVNIHVKNVLFQVYENCISKGNNELDEMLEHVLDIKSKFINKFVKVNYEVEDSDLFFKPKWHISDFSSLKALKIWRMRMGCEFNVSSMNVFMIIMESLTLPMTEQMLFLKKLYYRNVTLKLLSLLLNGSMSFFSFRIVRLAVFEGNVGVNEITIIWVLLMFWMYSSFCIFG